MKTGRLGTLAVLACLMMVTSISRPAAAQSLPDVKSPIVILSGGTLDLQWLTTPGRPTNMIPMSYQARLAVVRINGVNHDAMLSDWQIRGGTIRSVALLYRDLNGGPLPDGVVTRVTVNNRPYIDNSGYRFLLPDLPDPTPVPTMTQWGMILLGLLFAVTAALTIKTRRTRAA